MSDSVPQVVYPKHVREQKAYNEAKAAGLTVSGEELHRIHCPYEPAGAALAPVRQKAGQVELPVGEILQCDHCKRFFKIGVRISLIGQPLEDQT